jgi:DNA modification methylase
VKSSQINIEAVVWEPGIYPRQKWNASTIERYADAIEAGEQFPPIILEQDTNRLLDGKHRLEAHKRVGAKSICAEWHTVPDGMSAKYYAASLSARHGDRLSNADIKEIAEGEFEADPQLDPVKWGRGLGVSKSTVYRWVSHILERERADRASKAWRLSKLGWRQEAIAAKLNVKDRSSISLDVKNSHLGKIHETLGEHWNDKGIAEVANRLNLSLTDCYAAALDGMTDTQRLERLDIKLQPYDVWQFPSCHDLMGDRHPGRIPGQLIAHALYFFTQPGDTVIDPMVGSGTTLDACLLMGRKCFGFDIDERHDRPDVIRHNILKDGWHSHIEKADLIFWDPPYFEKMDSQNIGEDGYIEGSISKLSRSDYLDFFAWRLAEAKQFSKMGSRLAFLMSDWDDDTGEREGIFVWDYADLIRKAGWKLVRHIQAPLSTQQVHPDIVNKFRESRRLARLERYLLIAEA